MNILEFWFTVSPPSYSWAHPNHPPYSRIPVHKVNFLCIFLVDLSLHTDLERNMQKRFCPCKLCSSHCELLTWQRLNIPLAEVTITQHNNRKTRITTISIFAVSDAVSRCQRSRIQRWKSSMDAGGQGWAQRCSKNKEHDVTQDKQDWRRCGENCWGCDDVSLL
jgi:hypothetical protein